MAYTQIVKFTVQSEHSEAFNAALLADKSAFEQNKTHIASRYYVDKKQPNLFFRYERWLDKAAYNQSLPSSQVSALQALMPNAISSQTYTLNDTTPAPMQPLDAAESDPTFDIFFIFKIQPGSKDELLAQFAQHIKHTRDEDGCLLFDLYTVQGDEQTLVVYEHWRKESDVWDIHFHQPYAVTTGQLMEKYVIGDMNQYMNFVTQIA
ncbi:putative quinol monooxygenase [Vibrio rarus]|uniref:putative quinol monooxygenase n=1 Tax=Vibrio rarus TaxID=413403 RepID=UPI0021C3C20F|nr:antibiotic biosynthesis monooxygenase [Vibrio rarus]